MKRDVIGDVHGHADQLEALLRRLSYDRSRGVWRHPDATAIFVGDFIDRGPHQLRTLEIVRGMIEGGSARAVMGNHELNAIGYATPDPQRPARYLRDRNEKNTSQHAAFLAEVGLDSPLHRSWIYWFLKLPLWIETPIFRVVHACWDPTAVETMRTLLHGSDKLLADDFHDAFRPGRPLRESVEVLLRGPELALPKGASFVDKDGHVRTAIRTRWWAPELTTFDRAYIGPEPAGIPALKLPAHSTPPEPDRPTFIGHYWLEPSATPAPLHGKVACVDYSVAKGGRLTAYRFQEEAMLTPENFVAI